MKRDNTHNAWRNTNWVIGTREDQARLAPMIMEILERQEGEKNGD
jgi:hypothetical protein